MADAGRSRAERCSGAVCDLEDDGQERRAKVRRAGRSRGSERVEWAVAAAEVIAEIAWSAGGVRGGVAVLRNGLSKRKMQ